MNVSAVIVTRGDVDLAQIIVSIPAVWEIIVYDNSGQVVRLAKRSVKIVERRVAERGVPDWGVYGRYHAALNVASNPVVFVQDDDVVLAPESFDALQAAWRSRQRFFRDALVANMPAAWRDQDFYADHCLVGFGAMFERRLAEQAFRRLWASGLFDPVAEHEWFNRTCDVFFTALNERVLVDVPYENLPWATGPDRMYRDPAHVGERQRALDLALQVRGG